MAKNSSREVEPVAVESAVVAKPSATRREIAVKPAVVEEISIADRAVNPPYKRSMADHTWGQLKKGKFTYAKGAAEGRRVPGTAPKGEGRRRPKVRKSPFASCEE